MLPPPLTPDELATLVEQGRAEWKEDPLMPKRNLSLLARTEIRMAKAEELLDEIAAVAAWQYQDWMHFHEVAMADPFRAERDAQAFARRILDLGTHSRPEGDEDAG